MATRSLSIGLALALVAGPLALAVTALASDPPGCSGAWYASRVAHHNLQNDADSGHDAGNVRADATRLRAENYSWGFVSPATHDGGDDADWYSFVFNGTGQLVMMDVRATANRNHTYLDLGAYHPDQLRLRIEVWEPGTEEPTHVGIPNYFGGTNATFVNDVAGVHHIKVAWGGVGGAKACTDERSEPPVFGVDTTVSPDNYGVYFGCRPVCRNAAV